MPRHASDLPPELGESFSCADAVRAGVSRGRLRARDLEAPFRGSRLRVSEDGDREFPDDTPFAGDRAQRARVMRLARAYSEVMEPHAFFAGRTAGVMWGAPLRHGAALEVAVLAPARAPRRRGIRSMKVAPTLAGVTALEGMPLTSPASTWAMLAREMTVRELVVLGDWCVRIPRDSRGRLLPGEQRASPAQLRRAADAGARRGAGRLRTALDLIRVGSASPLESEFRIDAAAAGLPEPELDVEIRGGSGRLLGISDAVYRAYGTIVEVEGDHHRTSRAQWNRDIEKYAAYAAAGWEVVRLTADHIRGTSPRAASIVSEALIRRGWRPV